MSFIFRIIVFAGIFTSVANQLTKERNVIIITDMEPDDRIALAVASIRMPQRILFIGTTLMNSHRKAALAEHQLNYFSALKNVKVFAGTGGTPDDYPEMNSTIAGPTSSNKLQQEIHNTLNEAIGKVLRTIQRAGKSWDDHLMEAIPALREAIGDRHAGRQFTPADALVIVGFLNPGMIKAQRNVSVKIPVNQENDPAGYLVKVKQDTNSPIKVVDEIDERLFIAEMEYSIGAINEASGGTS
ncbi:hypothetical protein DdX_19751 [Ditylenchus destructor]|uniref:Inosine/uridine-preferring nucleoside hydrolase domain-containing protein n=1 Tax=Ditylenchus destructor TaxID=166010 RepID=A0AAD4MJ60_9BILA|nr:hypothetical protein DdX_19751 [Ditylenchus destructor]